MKSLKQTAVMACLVSFLGFVNCTESEPEMNGFYYYTYWDGNGNLLESAYCDVTDADSVKVVFGNDNEGDFISYNMSIDENSPDEPSGEMWAYEAGESDLVPYTDYPNAYMRCEATNDVGNSEKAYYFPL